MKIEITMIMKDEQNTCATITESFDDVDDDVYEPEFLADLASRLLHAYGYPNDTADDIQSIGWSRLVKEKPAKELKCLVSYKDGQILHTDIDIWDGKRFKKFGNKVVFWACLPSHPLYWSNNLE